MKGITVLIGFLFLLKINTLSAQAAAKVNTGEVDIGLINIEDKPDFSDATSLNPDEQIEFSVYPSPAKDDINIKFEYTQATTIRMSNILGNVLHETTTNPTNTRLYSTTLNVSNLPKGLYFITIDDGVNAQTQRFVKQ